MSDFSTEATVEFRVDKSSLRDVRSTVEDELGATEVGATDGGAASAQSGRLSGRRRRRARRTFRLDRERNERLGEVVALLDDIEENIGEGGGGGGLTEGLGQGLSRGLTGLGLGAGTGLAGIGIGAGVGLATGDLPEGIGRGLGEAVGLSAEGIGTGFGNAVGIGAEGIGEGLGSVLGDGGDFFEGIGEGLGGVLHGPGDEQTTVENVSVQQAQFSLDTATIQMDQGAIGSVVVSENRRDTSTTTGTNTTTPQTEPSVGHRRTFDVSDDTSELLGPGLGELFFPSFVPNPSVEDIPVPILGSDDGGDKDFSDVGRGGPVGTPGGGEAPPPPGLGEPTPSIDPMNRPNLGPDEIRGGQPTGGGGTTERGTTITQIDTLTATGVAGSIDVTVEAAFDRLRSAIERELGSEIDRVERELEGEIEQLRRDITGR